MLKTKSIQKKPTKSDGIRICIMRRIKPEFEFDMWIKPLSPSTELLKSYHDKKINWQQFEAKFTKQVLDKQEKYLKIIANLAKETDVTIMCWEETPEMCHRRLVTQRIQKINKKLEVSIK